MKSYAWLLMLAAALFVGCEQPVAESDPSVTPNSGVSEEAHTDHDHADHDHADHDHADEEHGDDH
ncbi:MAG: hypothetical protein NXI32_26495 [bacterium]|nr:hypothetical protein [bacterium]